MLDVLARPDVGALNANEDFSLVIDDRVHHDPIEEGPDNRVHDLDGECAFG